MILNEIMPYYNKMCKPRASGDDPVNSDNLTAEFK